MASFMDRVKRSWKVFNDGPDDTSQPIPIPLDQLRTSVSMAAPQHRTSYDSSKAVLAPIMTRIAIDASSMPIRHVVVDENDNFTKFVRSELDDRLNIRANIDQSGVAFLQDAVMTMLTEGAVALVPVEVTSNPSHTVYDILSVRVGSIVEWKTGAVRVSLYNELTGQRVERDFPKSYVAIAYNPLYAVMNEPNSTLRRLIDRLALLDVADGKQFSPQLDLIIQLPYTLKNERRQADAEARLATIESQLSDSKYGIAYLDATEKITQLNRPVTNVLVETIVTLTESLHAQLGLTANIFSGTATPEEILLYQNRTVIPVIKSLTDAMLGSFLTRTAISQGHRLMVFPTLFKMAPLAEFATAADTFTRNEILTSNEVRAYMGLPPSKDPEADELRNKNLNKPPEETPVENPTPSENEPEGDKADE